MYKSLNLVTVIILFMVFQLNPIFLSGQTAKIFAPGVVSLEDMEDAINTKENEDFPCVSPDGKYLFFTRLSKDSQGKEIGDIYWIDAGVLGTLPNLNTGK